MTELLQQAFDKVAQFPEVQQEIFARLLLKIDYIDPEEGPVFRLGPEEYDRHGITDEDIQQTRAELGLE